MLVPISPHQVNHTLARERGDHPCPAIFGEPLLLESKNILTFLVGLIYKGQKMEELAKDRRTGQLVGACVVKSVRLLEPIVDAVASCLPTRRDHKACALLGPGVVAHYVLVDAGEVGVHHHPVAGRPPRIAGTKDRK